MCDWFKSYLTYRQLTVQLNETRSLNQNIMCGVPQCSILGPLLFLLYKNNLNKALKQSSSLLFAVFYKHKIPHI